MTRLAVFFYRHLPKVAGPVRSMRASDIGIVKPAHGVIVASGAAGPTIARMKRAKVPFTTEGGPGYFRAGDRSAPYNLMVNMPELAKAKKKKSVVPASYLPWGTESDFKGARPAKSIDAVFSRSHTTSWRYQGGKYRNQNSNAAAGDRFVPDSVLVIRVRLTGRRLPRPGRQLRARDDLRGLGQDDALPQGQGRQRHLEEAVAADPGQAQHQGRLGEGPRRTCLDRARPERQGRRQGRLPQVVPRTSTAR